MGVGCGGHSSPIRSGPGQANADLAFSKTIPVKWPSEGSSLQLRAERYNAPNHPQFANPDSTFTSPAFGIINCTAVSPRGIQLALRLAF
jgi:hypothetical protein